MANVYYNPVKIIDSENWIDSWHAIQEELGVIKPLVITFKENVSRLRLNKFFNPDSIYTAVVNNPTFASCQEAIEFRQSNNFDCIVAIGGGSVMDTAKAVSAARGTGIYDLSELLNFSDSYPDRIPSVFIPTTHGTSSEVTMWATIWYPAENKKYSLSHPDLYPDYAILDGTLTVSLPLDISLSTTLDAMSHSFEAIWNKNSNDQSTQYAIQAISQIFENIEGLKSNPSDISIRRNLLKAANTAGLAFSNTRTAAAHSISYPLTSFFNIPHGIAASMPLIPLIEINQRAITQQLDQINAKSNLKSNAELQVLIQSIPGNKIKFNLKDWGVCRDDLPNLVDYSFTKGRMDNNIIDLTKDDVIWILNEIYS